MDGWIDRWLYRKSRHIFEEARWSQISTKFPLKSITVFGF